MDDNDAANTAGTGPAAPAPVPAVAATGCADADVAVPPVHPAAVAANIMATATAAPRRAFPENLMSL